MSTTNNEHAMSMQMTDSLMRENKELRQQAILRDLEIVRLREALECAQPYVAQVVAHIGYMLKVHEKANEDYAQINDARSTPIDLSALARHDEEIVGICTWTPMDSEYMPGTYEGTCGVAWSFTEGGLSDNETLCCPRCGGKIIDATKGEKD